LSGEFLQPLLLGIFRHLLPRGGFPRLSFFKFLSSLITLSRDLLDIYIGKTKITFERASCRGQEGKHLLRLSGD
jgi:hypothetical protein